MFHQSHSDFQHLSETENSNYDPWDWKVDFLFSHTLHRNHSTMDCDDWFLGLPYEVRSSFSSPA